MVGRVFVSDGFLQAQPVKLRKRDFLSGVEKKKGTILSTSAFQDPSASFPLVSCLFRMYVLAFKLVQDFDAGGPYIYNPQYKPA